MDWGFTGSSDYGLTNPQLRKLVKLLSDANVSPGITLGTFHHGSAINCDDQAGWQAHLLGYWIVVHPSDNPKKRAYSYCDEILPERPYLARNHDIVNACRKMLATPHWNEEPRKGTRGDGTLATINYARRVQRPGIILLPTGRELDMLTGKEL